MMNRTDLKAALCCIFLLVPSFAQAQELVSRDPRAWGTHLRGVWDHLQTKKKVIALTFDACGARGDGFDEELIQFLMDNETPATLFISGLWIKKNKETFRKLTQVPFFRIANHGNKHRQLSGDGKGKYNWGKTHGELEIREEVIKNTQRIFDLTGVRPHFFRSGTAHYDFQALSVLKKLGVQPVGYSHSADGGATLSKRQILSQGLKKATPGGIYLFHMNWPESETFEGLRDLLPALEKKGYSFDLIDNYPLEQRIIKN